MTKPENYAMAFAWKTIQGCDYRCPQQPKLWYKSYMADADRYLENAATTAILVEAGIALMRQNLRRQHPHESEAEIDARLNAWLYRADDPIPGDTAGPVRVRERAQ